MCLIVEKEEKRKPRGYWENYDNCFQEALKYSSRSEFATGSSGAYDRAKINGWLDTFEWLNPEHKPRGYWDDYENCYNEAKKYKTRTEFARNAVGAYEKCCLNKWIETFDWFIKPENPNKIWNYEACKAEALKYKTKVDFGEGSRGAWYAAYKNGWMKDYTWFVKRENRNKKWTYDVCLEEAKKYRTTKELREQNICLYTVCEKNGWLDSFDFLERERAKRKTWTNYENCYKEAQKYMTLTEFCENASSAYQNAVKRGWLSDYTWLKREHTERGYWQSYENCYNEALKYQTRHELKEGSNTAYHSARKHGWLDDYTWLRNGKLELVEGKVDSVYAYEFVEFNAVYVGRTLIKRQKTRDREHLFKDDTVARFAKENNIPVPEMKILETDLTVKEGSEHEGLWVEKYRESGWKILNKAKTGAIGSIGNIKWTRQNCYELAKKCNSFTELRKLNLTVYEKAREKGWIFDYYWLDVKNLSKETQQQILEHRTEKEQNTEEWQTND